MSDIPDDKLLQEYEIPTLTLIRFGVSIGRIRIAAARTLYLLCFAETRSHEKAKDMILATAQSISEESASFNIQHPLTAKEP